MLKSGHRASRATRGVAKGKTAGVSQRQCVCTLGWLWPVCDFADVTFSRPGILRRAGPDSGRGPVDMKEKAQFRFCRSAAILLKFSSVTRVCELCGEVSIKSRSTFVLAPAFCHQFLWWFQSSAPQRFLSLSVPKQSREEADTTRWSAVTAPVSDSLCLLMARDTWAWNNGDFLDRLYGKGLLREDLTGAASG